MESMILKYTEDPTFQVIIRELRKFEFISYITVHASLNNIAYHGDSSTKHFIQSFKSAFNHDLNQMTDYLKDYLANQNTTTKEVDHHQSSSNFQLPDISEISRTILALSFPFFLKSYEKE